MRFIKLIIHRLLASIFSIGIFSNVAVGGPNMVTNRPIGLPQMSSLMFTTKPYKREALKLVLQEANQVAESLHLPEDLPICETNIVGWYISPPRMALFTKAIGNITTSNYVYYVSVGDKFSYLEGVHQDADRRRWFEEYSWPVSRLNTNEAYQLATQWLAAASMDVAAMNKEYDLHIYPTALRGQGTNAYFLPVYWVTWTKGAEGHGSVASVELFTPNKTLMQLRVEDSKYILRRPLQITNLDNLLLQTNAPPVAK